IGVPDYQAPSIELAPSRGHGHHARPDQDSGVSGDDGVTNVAEPVFRVTLNGNEVKGLVLQLFSKAKGADEWSEWGEEPFATHTLTWRDIRRGWVDIKVPEEAADGYYAVAARLASPNGSEHTELSAPYFVEVDSQIEPPVLDF